MGMKKSRLLFQVLFLVLFATLLSMGRIQLWFIVFATGILMSTVVGRVYCGWICPMNTVMRWITAFKGKYKIKSFSTPKSLESPWVRGVVLALFLCTFLLVKITGIKLPVLPAIFSIAILLTLLFPEELWHRYLCPYGTILTVPASVAKKSIKINRLQCNNCGACTRVCPTRSAEKWIESHRIEKKECLSCGTCIEKCRKTAIVFK